MKLIDLNPAWVGSGGEGVRNADGSPVPRREAIGIWFDCPCGCEHPVYVSFSNPADGLGPFHANDGHPMLRGIRRDRVALIFGRVALMVGRHAHVLRDRGRSTHFGGVLMPLIHLLHRADQAGDAHLHTKRMKRSIDSYSFPKTYLV